MNFQPVNTFQAFTGTLCNLEHQNPQNSAPVFQNAFLASQNSNVSGFQFNNAFTPFQQNISIQYSLSNNDSQQIVGLFVNMVTEILTNISNSFMTQGGFNPAPQTQQQPAFAPANITENRPLAINTNPNTNQPAAAAPVNNNAASNNAEPVVLDTADNAIGEGADQADASNRVPLGCSFLRAQEAPNQD